MCFPGLGGMQDDAAEQVCALGNQKPLLLPVSAAPCFLSERAVVSAVGLQIANYMPSNA